MDDCGRYEIEISIRRCSRKRLRPASAHKSISGLPILALATGRNSLGSATKVVSQAKSCAGSPRTPKATQTIRQISI